jgi:hypothetical protein
LKSDQYKKVFEGKAIEANFVKGILDENGISSIVKDDMMSQVFPLYVASGELKPVKVYVDRDAYENARRLIDIYTSNRDDQNLDEEK